MLVYITQSDVCSFALVIHMLVLNSIQKKNLKKTILLEY